MSKKETDRRTLKYKKGKDFGIAVQLYREGSGGRVVHPPNDKWVQEMQQISNLNYGEICIVMRPSRSPGYEDSHGINIILVPGALNGDRGDNNKLRNPMDPSGLTSYGLADGLPSISTNLYDAIRLYKALGETISAAKKLGKKRP